MTTKKQNLIVRTITGILFITIMLVGLTHPLALPLLFSLITALSLWEYTGIVNNLETVNTNRFITTVAGVYLYLSIFAINSGVINNNAIFIPYLLTIVYLFISELYTKASNPINNWAYTMLAQMYIALPLSTINILAYRTDLSGNVHFHHLLPLSIFIFLWLSDTGAYICGSLFGKHKLFPRISPAKSWEGSIGGGIFVIIASIIINYYNTQSGNFSGLNLYQWIGLGIVVTISGTLGDLVESLFKRTIGIKDSGRILPGHGGMLDRFDSSLMAIPSAVIYIYALSLLN